MLNGPSNADSSGLCQVLSHELIEHAADHVSGLAVHAARLERILPHLLEKDRDEGPLQSRRAADSSVCLPFPRAMSIPCSDTYCVMGGLAQIQSKASATLTKSKKDMPRREKVASSAKLARRG